MNMQTLWQILRQETELACQNEPALAGFLHLTVLRHPDLAHVLAFHLSGKLAGQVIEARLLYEIFLNALKADPLIVEAAACDIQAYYERDAACDAYTTPLLYFKGYHAIQSHRINHFLWQQQRKTLAYLLQNRASEVFGVDIHPGARIGRGIMIDHGTGVVIGETATLGDNISILHGVTLGGSGKESGDRHPKIGDGVMIGANASILGNIRVEACAKIGAGSVVLDLVPARATVAGVPAKIVGRAVSDIPAANMDQRLE